MAKEAVGSTNNYRFCVKSLRWSTTGLCAFVSLLFLGGAIDAAGGPDPQPLIMLMYAVLLIPFLVLTFRCARIQIAVADGVVVVRNIWKTRIFPAEQVEAFSMGYEQAIFPGGEGAGTIQLRDGSKFAVIALSQQSMFASHPRPEVVEAIDDLNEIIRPQNAND